MKNETLVKIQHVSFKYHTQPVLEDITLEIKRGDFLGIIGPNGSGKTTLLKIILGLLKPNSGSVQLFGHQVQYFKDWAKIGYVPQKAGSQVTQFPITVEEVVALGRVKPGLFEVSSDNETAIAAAMEAVEISELRHQLLNQLSGGQQQRVFIARALASQPELLILDEPTVGVDSDSQTKFYQLLKKLNKDRSTCDCFS